MALGIPSAAIPATSMISGTVVHRVSWPSRVRVSSSAADRHWIVTATPRMVTLS